MPETDIQRINYILIAMIYHYYYIRQIINKLMTSFKMFVKFYVESFFDLYQTFECTAACIFLQKRDERRTLFLYNGMTMLYRIHRV